MGGVVWSRDAANDQPVETFIDPVAGQECAAHESERKTLLQEDMRRFKEEMGKKREARQEALKNLNKKITELQEEKEKEIQENSKLRDELNKLRSGSEVEELRKKIEILESATNSRNSEETTAVSPDEKMMDVSETVEEDLKEKDEVIEGLERQVKALKDVAMIGGEMLRIREQQVNELRSKLEAIEETGAAYEKEVENMKKLRNLYEERASAMTISHQMELEREKTKLIAAEARQKIAEHRSLELEEKNKELEDQLKKVDTNLDDAKSQISELKIKLAGKNEDLYDSTSQMAVVNHLFGQLLTPGQDSLEKITKVLEEHHDLVNHLTANGKINDLASTLVEIADKDPLPNIDDQESDISGHLSKVWRLLVELLGHHIAKPQPDEPGPESCYKSVNTPTGPKLVISVSQTFLRLKDLILEKNTLLKELGRLKDLNSTLETRLLEQESRLSVVTSELHSTWSVVNKLKRQHRNLHSSEQVLRYELAQKRLLLNELKKKLEECKENWSLAREKNSQTEKDWIILRSEFALRKQQTSSAESGYEESPTDSQDEDDNWKDSMNDKSSTSASEDESGPCTVLAWNAAEEPRTERRGTLTESSPPTEGDQSAFINFRVDEEVDHCTVLPWTYLEEPMEIVDAQTESSSSVINSSNIGSRLSLSSSEGGAGNENQDYEKNANIPQPSSSGIAGMPNSVSHQPRTAEEILQARQDRLRRLEEGCKGLFNKMNQTNQRSEIINSRLTELHEIYGDDSRTRRRHDSEGETSALQQQTLLDTPGVLEQNSDCNAMQEPNHPPKPSPSSEHPTNNQSGSCNETSSLTIDRPDSSTEDAGST